MIRGGVTTLRELELDAAQRDLIVRSIEEAAVELEQVALHPEPAAPEERGLRPRPQLDQPPG